MFFDALCNLCTGLKQQPLKKLKKSPLTFACLGQILNIYPLYEKIVCSLLRYLLIFHSSELWISSYFLRGQLSACTTMCPADTLLLNVACAIQEQVWDLSWGSLRRGLLPHSCGDRRPRKPNVIAIVWVEVRVVLFPVGGFFTIRLKSLWKNDILVNDDTCCSSAHTDWNSPCC